jgi:hypothetical protein
MGRRRWRSGVARHDGCRADDRQGIKNGLHVKLRAVKTATSYSSSARGENRELEEILRASTDRGLT